MSDELTPDNIMQLGFGFWSSKTLLSAVELGVFSELAEEPLDLETLRQRLSLHPRSARDFFDALVALRMLDRNGALYSNTPETEFFLDRAKPSYMGGILEMANARLYHFWGSLTEGLRTGQPQNEIKAGGDFFGVLYQDPARLKQFMHAMTGISMGAAKMMAQKFPGRNIEHSSTSVPPREDCPSKSPLRIPISPAVASTCRSSAKSSTNTWRPSASAAASVSTQATSSRISCRTRMSSSWDTSCTTGTSKRSGCS